MITEVLFASTNKTKLDEVRAMFTRDLPDVKILSPNDININIDGIEENKATYMENAIDKALAVWKMTDGKYHILADDSGYEIEQWGDLPGIYTHRSLNKYPVTNLDMSKSLMIQQRNAMCFMWDNSSYLVTDHIVSGNIVNELRGNYGSYYMNAMIPEGYDKTFAELGDEVILTQSARAHSAKFIIDTIYAWNLVKL